MHTKVARVRSNQVYFKNWNDLQILLKVAEHKSFARAADALGINQVTVAKRLADLEMALGCRLFTRRRIGAAPTQACQALLDEASIVVEAMQRVETRLETARALQPSVTIYAPPGVLAYTLQPALQAADEAQPIQPIDMRLLRRSALPDLHFTANALDADILILVSAEHDLPKIKGAYSVKRLGSMFFRPYASRAMARNKGVSIASFEDLKDVTLFDMKLYRAFSSLSAWNEMLEDHPHAEMFESTSDLHASFLEREAVTIIPTYSHLYERRIVPLEIAYPRMALSLWLAAHEDNLREPQVRKVFDTLGDAFERSPWFH